MDKITKDALTKSKDSLSDESLAKRKEINKKILKYFAYAIFLLVLIVIIGTVMSGSSKEESDKNNVKSAQSPIENILNLYPKEENGVFTEILENPLRESILIHTNDPAAQVVSKFLSAWQKKDWDSMKEYTQNSWRAKEKNPVHYLSSRFSDLELLGAKIKGVTKSSSDYTNMYDVEVSLRYSYPPLVKMESKKIRVVYEGSWGVNPVSASSLQGRSGIALEAFDVQKYIQKKQ